ncbi:hypothetical protein J6A31_00985 [bacterium]|nr:hypothetical protein [bacterium]
MNIIAINMDNIILGIYKNMERILNKKGYSFDIGDMKTFDFNQSLSDEYYITLGTPLSEIYTLLHTPELYKTASYDWDIITLIRRYAEWKMQFIIYADRVSDGVFMAKQALFSKWFGYMPNIKFKPFSEDDKLKLNRYKVSVIVDSECKYMSDCSLSVQKNLVDKQYNREVYNTKFAAVFGQESFNRYDSAEDAIRAAVRFVELQSI